VPVLAPPRDLTLPEPGSTTARDLFSRALGRLVRELRPTLRAHAASAPEDVAAVDRALAALGDPAPLASVLRRPHVGALARSLGETPPGRGEGLLVELLATLAGDLAHLGAIAPVALRRRPARVVSPLTHPQDYRPVEGEIRMALADNNPLAMVEAHPDKQGNAVDLGERSVDEWLAALRAALTLVGAHLPETRAEMDLFVQQVVPTGYFTDRHLSASYREAIGTVYLSLHPSHLTMAEALVHECQHGKLNALFAIDDVLDNADEPLYDSPVRPDPRPLRGVLLAVHAFVAVARLYERRTASLDAVARVAGGPQNANASSAARPKGADSNAVCARFREVVRMNREGTAVLLAHARPTRVGRAVLEELARWDAHFATVHG
jgi:hypothetical protein